MVNCQRQKAKQIKQFYLLFAHHQSISSKQVTLMNEINERQCFALQQLNDSQYQNHLDVSPFKFLMNISIFQGLIIKKLLISSKTFSRQALYQIFIVFLSSGFRETQCSFIVQRIHAFQPQVKIRYSPQSLSVKVVISAIQMQFIIIYQANYLMFTAEQVKVTPKSNGNVNEGFLPYFEAEKVSKRMKRELWTQQENKRYVKFLREHSEWFTSESVRRERKVFAEAAKFVGTKTCKQVKSHHQKLLIKLQTIENIIDSDVKPLWPTEPSLKCLESVSQTPFVVIPRDKCSILSQEEFQYSNQLFRVVEQSFFIHQDIQYEEEKYYQYKNDQELISQFENGI